LYALVLGLVLAGPGWALWMNVFRDWFRPHDWGVVEPGRIYRSGQLSRHLLRRTLRQHNIGLIVSLSGDLPPTADVRAEKAAAAEMGIRRLGWNIRGTGVGNAREYAEALAEIDRARRQGTPVLVHCQTGSERTGAAVAYWRVLVQHRSGADAYAEMRYYHHSPKENPKLVPYLNEHMGEMARLLVEEHVIDAVPDPLPVIGP
jgi:protein tyrosine/serine phosphatase